MGRSVSQFSRANHLFLTIGQRAVGKIPKRSFTNLREKLTKDSILCTRLKLKDSGKPERASSAAA